MEVVAAAASVLVAVAVAAEVEVDLGVNRPVRLRLEDGVADCKQLIFLIPITLF